MKTALSDLDLRVASSVNEALTILRDEKRTPIAGATDVYVGLNFGTFKPRQYLDIWALDELRTISTHDDKLIIGALTSYTSLMQSHIVAERVPMLVEASGLVGGVQILKRCAVRLHQRRLMARGQKSVRVILQAAARHNSEAQYHKTRKILILTT